MDFFFFDICCLFLFCRWPAPNDGLVNNKCQKKKSKLKVELLFSASSFGKMVKQNVTQNWIMNNFRIVHLDWEKNPSYPNAYSLKIIIKWENACLPKTAKYVPQPITKERDIKHQLNHNLFSHYIHHLTETLIAFRYAFVFHIKCCFWLTLSMTSI